jgi:histidinol phosphatase-like enzyme (inositol monophosphatase family)
MSQIDLDALGAFANQLADASGAVIRPYFRSGIAVVTKGDGSPVTRADRETEAAIRSRIEAAYPEHGIYGEEHGRAREGARYQWVIDPIDGTKAFLVGIPLFGTLIALCDDGRPILGVIDQPIARERWVGIKGRGATLNGRPIRTRSGVAIADAMMCSTTPTMFEGGKGPRHARLAAQVSFVRWGVDCYAAGMLACGNVDFMVEASLKPYDFLALVPVIEEAGGVVSDWDGRPLTIASGETFLASASPDLHREALTLLRD